MRKLGRSWWIAATAGVVALGTAGAPATAWQVTEELTWSRGWSSVVGFMRRAALAEAAAHLKHLVDAGRVTQIASEPVRYQLAG